MTGRLKIKVICRLAARILLGPLSGREVYIKKYEGSDWTKCWNGNNDSHFIPFCSSRSAPFLDEIDLRWGQLANDILDGLYEFFPVLHLNQ